MAAVSQGHYGDMGLIPNLVQWIKGSGIAMAVLKGTAVAGIQSLILELPYATVQSLKK